MVADPARTLAVLCALLLALLVRAQDGSAPTPSGPTAAPPELASPRAAVGTFLRSMNDADIPQAVQALDLSKISPLERVDRSSQLAFKPWAILNREAYVVVDALPDASDAPVRAAHHRARRPGGGPAHRCKGGGRGVPLYREHARRP